MVSCAVFCKNSIYAILSLVMGGIISLALVIFLIQYSNAFTEGVLLSAKTGLIIATVICIILLIASIICSCIDSKITKTIVSLITILFDLIFLAIGIAMFVFKDEIDPFIKDNWDEMAGPIQDLFKCCNYNDEIQTNQNVTECKSEYEDTDCAPLINDKLVGGSKIIGGVAIAIFVVLLIIIVLLFIWGCRSGKREDSQSANQFNTPLTYGW